MFKLAILKNHKNKNIKLTFIVTIIITTIYCILSTNSRNSFLGIIISTAIMLGIKFLIIALLVLGFLYFFTRAFKNGIKYLFSYGIWVSLIIKIDL